MKDGKSLVRAGDNRYHAIFMTDGDALFVNPSSLAVPLIALGAKATILGPKGTRTIPVEKLYRVPKSNDDRELTLAPGELVTKVDCPARRQERLLRGPPEAVARLAAGHGGRQSEHGRRQRRRRIESSSTASRRSPGGARPPRAAIRGKAITMETAAAAGEAAAQGAKPLSMNAYKVPLVKTAVKRALLAAVGNRYWEA